MKYVLSVDSGGTFIKAGLYDENGRNAGLAKESGVANAARGECVELDLDSLWCTAARCVRTLIKESGVDPSEIEGIGFAGQGKGLYAIDADGRPVRPAITSSDGRARSYADRWMADGSAEKVRKWTRQEIAGSHPTAILAWLRDEEPSAYARIRWVFSMKDYLVYRASGQVIADRSNQSGNGLINLRTREYEPAILDALGLPEIGDKLPPLLDSAAVCGGLNEAAARELGCLPGTPVIAGLFDVNASALAAGIVDDKALCMITGTAGVNVYATPELGEDDAAAMTSLYCVPNLYLKEEGSSSSVATLDWVRKTLLSVGTEIPSYEECEGVAASVPAHASDAVFLPYLYGDGGAAAHGVWLGMSITDGSPELLRAAYEGVAFAHRRGVERLLGRPSGELSVRVTGGGTHSAFFLQVLADVFQQYIEVVPGEELGLEGVSLAIRVGLGHEPDFARSVRRWTSEGRRRYEPNSALAGVYDRKYSRFREAFERLRSFGGNS